MQESMKKVFELINKTGDRCIVVSPDSDEVYVILSLQEYERLVLGKAQVSELNEDELLDKINRDIAVWKSQQTEDDHDAMFGAEIDDKMSPVIDNYNNNSANISQNSDDYLNWNNEEEFEEEPYYFEHV